MKRILPSIFLGLLVASAFGCGHHRGAHHENHPGGHLREHDGGHHAKHHGGQCQHGPASLTDAEVAAIVSGAYCLATAGKSRLGTYSVPRDHRGSSTCEEACLAFSAEHYPNATGTPFEAKGVGDLECTLYRSPNGELETVLGRPSEYHESDTTYCDWCCCQLH